MTDVRLNLNEGTSEYMLSEIDGTAIFKKIAPPLECGGLKELTKLLTEFMIKDMPLQRHLVHNTSYSERIEKEAKTLSLWAENGIDVIPMYGYDESSILFKHCDNASSVRCCLETEIGCHDKFLDIYDSIRVIAKRDNNPDMLHSDPHLENFLYDADSAKVFPIDPALHLNKNMSFSELDTELVVRTLRAYDQLQVPESRKKGLIREFKETLSNKDIDSVLKYDSHVSDLTKLFFTLREEVAYRVKGREKQNPLGGIFDFYSNLNGYINTILME